MILSKYRIDRAHQQVISMCESLPSISLSLFFSMEDSNIFFKLANYLLYDFRVPFDSVIDLTLNYSCVALEEPLLLLNELLTVQVLWPECGWQAVSLTDLITGASVKKAYRKATLCIHPDKVQQKGANIQQKYIAEKVFDLLKVHIYTILYILSLCNFCKQVLWLYA